VTISQEQRKQAEDRIRAAMDRLLRGELSADGKCDIKTLAAEAGVSRAALYRTYTHLKDEFEQRLQRLTADEGRPDPRAAQIDRLQQTNAELRGRNADHRRELADATSFRTLAISRIAAQHDEIQRLRSQIRSADVTVLRPPANR
jgi:hypothetical protein